MSWGWTSIWNVILLRTTPTPHIHCGPKRTHQRQFPTSIHQLPARVRRRFFRSSIETIANRLWPRPDAKIAPVTTSTVTNILGLSLSHLDVKIHDNNANHQSIFKNLARQSSQIPESVETQQFSVQYASYLCSLQNRLSWNNNPFIMQKNVTYTIVIYIKNNIPGTVSVTTPQKRYASSMTGTQSTVILRQSTPTAPPPPIDNNKFSEILTPSENVKSNYVTSVQVPFLPNDPDSDPSSSDYSSISSFDSSVFPRNTGVNSVCDLQNTLNRFLPTTT